MADVEVRVPDNLEEIIMKVVQQRVDAALSVAPEVGTIIKDIAILDEKDAYGNPIPHKQPKPKKSPKNFPGLQLIQSGEMMSNDRWTVDRADETTSKVVYSPPAYFEYVIEKRPWITSNKINDEARRKIQEDMHRRAMSVGVE